MIKVVLLMMVGVLSIAGNDVPSFNREVEIRQDAEIRKKAETFLKSLQTALRADDKKAVCKLICYSYCRWNRNNKRVVYIQNKNQFMKNYSKIFTTHLKNIVERSKPEELFIRNINQVMIGSGEIWFEVPVVLSDRRGIISINER